MRRTRRSFAARGRASSAGEPLALELRELARELGALARIELGDLTVTADALAEVALDLRHAREVEEHHLVGRPERLGLEQVALRGGAVAALELEPREVDERAHQVRLRV